MPREYRNACPLNRRQWLELVRIVWCDIHGTPCVKIRSPQPWPMRYADGHGWHLPAYSWTAPPSRQPGARRRGRSARLRIRQQPVAAMDPRASAGLRRTFATWMAARSALDVVIWHTPELTLEARSPARGLRMKCGPREFHIYRIEIDRRSSMMQAAWPRPLRDLHPGYNLRPKAGRWPRAVSHRPAHCAGPGLPPGILKSNWA